MIAAIPTLQSMLPSTSAHTGPRSIALQIPHFVSAMLLQRDFEQR
jgi:hypothetical protein